MKAKQHAPSKWDLVTMETTKENYNHGFHTQLYAFPGIIAETLKNTSSNLSKFL